MTNNTRTSPPLDKFASFPYEGNILAYFQGVFDSVFVVMQPFCHVAKENQEIFDREQDFGKADFIQYAQPITWQTVLTKLGINSQPDVEIYRGIETGILTHQTPLLPQYQNQTIAKRLQALEESENIFAPIVGEIAPYFQNDLLKAVQSLGYDWVWCGDEFATERKLYFIDDLIQSDTLMWNGRIFTPDYELLIGAIYNIGSVFICSSRDKIEQMRQAYPFEGFYCTPTTQVEWGALG